MPSRDETLSWIKKAQDDESAARCLLGSDESLAVIAYLLQQAAEKWLKACLIDRGTVPPRTHNLLELLKLIDGEWLDLPIVRSAQILNAFSSMIRYPGEVDPSPEAVKAGIESLELIKQRIAGLIDLEEL